MAPRKKVTKPAIQAEAAVVSAPIATPVAPPVAKAPDPKQVERAADVIAEDGLPLALRKAIRGCEFYIATPELRRGIDVGRLVDMISKVRSEKDAAEVNRIITTQINR